MYVATFRFFVKSVFPSCCHLSAGSCRLGGVTNTPLSLTGQSRQNTISYAHAFSLGCSLTRAYRHILFELGQFWGIPILVHAFFGATACQWQPTGHMGRQQLPALFERAHYTNTNTYEYKHAWQTAIRVGQPNSLPEVSGVATGAKQHHR